LIFAIRGSVGYGVLDMLATVKRCLTAVSVFAVVALGGCETLRQMPPAVRPSARMLRVDMPDAQLDYATLRFEMDVNNLSEIAWSVRGMRYGLTSGANMFLSAVPVPKGTVPAKSATVVSFTHQVVYERLLRALDVRPGATVPFTIEARLLLTTGDNQQVQLPLSCQGTLFLPPTAPPGAGEDSSRTVDVIYIPTPQDVVERMLRLAGLKKEDLVYDLGCGDGRIVVTAAREYGCRAFGCDIDPRRVQESRDNVRQNHVGHLVTVAQQDIFTVDLGRADVVAFYLNPLVNRRLIPQLQTLRPGARVVSHSFPVGDIKPDQIVTVASKEDGQEHYIYLYVAPLKVP
jgi:protein-L-isoaspartate O-methyltransferase